MKFRPRPTDSLTMPGQLPTDPRAVVSYVASHAQVWHEHAASIGVPPALAETLMQRLDRARAALAAAEESRQAALAATQAFYTAARELRGSAAAIVRLVHTTAIVGDDPEVYTTAQITPPSTPRRSAGSPAAPTGLKAALLTSSGGLELSWKSRQPRSVRNVAFQVFRAVAAHHSLRTTPEFIGITGQRRFVDTTLPPASALGQAGQITYTIAPVRGGRNGWEGAGGALRGTDVESLTPHNAASITVLIGGRGASRTPVRSAPLTLTPPPTRPTPPAPPAPPTRAAA